MVYINAMVEINDILGLRFLKPAAAASPRELLAGLQPGQTALVKVLARIARDEVILQIGAETLQVKDRSGLAPGREVMVAAVQDPDNEDELVLRILDRPARTGGSIPARFRAALPHIKPLGPLVKELINELEKLPVRPDSRAGRAIEHTLEALRASRFRPGIDPPVRLRNSLDRLGLGLEAALDRAVKQKEAPSPRAAARLRATVKAELIGLINQLRETAGNKAGPKPLPPDLERAINRLVLRLDQAVAAGSAGPRVALEGEPLPGDRIRLRPPDPQPLKHDGPAARTAAGGSDRTAAGSIKDPTGLAEAATAFRRRVVRALARLVNGRTAPADWSTEHRRSVIRRLDQATGRLVDQLVRTIANSSRQANQPGPVTRELIDGLRQSLVRMLAEFGLAGHRTAEPSLNRLEAGLQNLEFLQLINVTAQETDSALVIPLDWGPGMGLNQGEINLFHPPDRDRGKKDGPLRLLFALDMTKLGPVRIDVSLERNRLMINFFLAQEPMVLAGRARQSDLTERLNNLGYRVRNVSFRVIKKAPPREEIAPKPVIKRGMVDLKA